MSEPVLICPKSFEDGVKVCPECKDRKPATEAYFHKDRYSPDGWCPVCKECRAKGRHEQRIKQQLAELARVKVAMFSQIADGNGYQIPPNNEELASHLMAVWGGAEQLMRDMHADYLAADAGGSVRQKLLDLAVRILQKNAENKITIPLDAMSDEELDAALMHALERQSKRLESEDESGPERDAAESEIEASVG